MVLASQACGGVYRVFRVTPRLQASNVDPNWSELFAISGPLRNMRVMADAELLATGPGSGEASLLTGLLSHEDIQLWRYGDDGPPRGTPHLTSASGQRVAVGWAVAQLAPPGASSSYTLAWVVGEHAFHAELVGEPSLAASTDSRTKAYEYLDPDQAAIRRTADAVAACAARQIHADLYVTNREYLHQLTRPIGQGVTFCTPRDALALVGLYLRTQGEFLTWKDPGSNAVHRLDKRTYFWVGARELLSEGWRWYAACVGHAVGQDLTSDAHDLTYLGGAVFQRITRVLQARDNLLRAMNCKQDNNVAEDAMIALDTCLIFLMGALDASARVAHRVLGLPPGKVREAGWQRRDWLRSVEAVAPVLAEVAADTPGSDIVTILSRLRNTVHAAGLQALAIGPRGHREGTLAGLTCREGNQVLDAADRQGGRGVWGLQNLVEGRLHFDPGVLLEQLLPRVIGVMNKIMAATPVEQLARVSLKADDSLPPGDQDPAFGKQERQSIRWQLGM